METNCTPKDMRRADMHILIRKNEQILQEWEDNSWNHAEIRIFINQLEDWPGTVRIIIIRQAVVKGTWKHKIMFRFQNIDISRQN